MKPSRFKFRDAGAGQVFDPAAVDPTERLAQLTSQYAASPAFMGTGTATGLGRHDERGYRQMLEDSLDVERQFARLEGKQQPNVRFGGVMPSAEGQDVATGEFNPLSGGSFGGEMLPASVSHGVFKQAVAAMGSRRSPDMGAGYETHEQFKKRYGR